MAYQLEGAEIFYKDFVVQDDNLWESGIPATPVYWQFQFFPPVNIAVRKYNSQLKKLQNNVNVWAVWGYYGYEFFRARIVSDEMLIVLPENVCFAISGLWRDLGQPAGDNSGFKLRIHGPVGLSGSVNTRAGKFVLL